MGHLKAPRAKTGDEIGGKRHGDLAGGGSGAAIAGARAKLGGGIPPGGPAVEAKRPSYPQNRSGMLARPGKPTRLAGITSMGRAV